MSPHRNRQPRKCLWTRRMLLLVMLLGAFPQAAHAQLMVVGNDEKIIWDDAGKPLLMPPGKDTVSIVDIGTNPEAPRIIANIPLCELGDVARVLRLFPALRPDPILSSVSMWDGTRPSFRRQGTLLLSASVSGVCAGGRRVRRAKSALSSG